MANNKTKVGAPVLPGSTIGILGGGQLGRMIALEGRKMGYRFAVLDPTPNSPCGQVSDTEIVAAFTDVAAAKQLAAVSDVVTYEFENVDSRVAEALETDSVVPQGSRLLYITQHRVREKSTLSSHGIPVTPYAPVDSAAAFHDALQQFGFPCVLKTSLGGYDGKGQWLLRQAADVTDDVLEVVQRLCHAYSDELPDAPLVLEQFVPFVKELSVVVARNANGETMPFPVAENIHVHHILHESIVPARISDEIATRAQEIAMRIAKELTVVGLIAVEMFLTNTGDIFVNELAPRPHNSGHYTLDACVTSQFEQHLRAVCNLPLGDVNLLTPVVMVNVLGQHVNPLLQRLSALPASAKVHLYGKQEAKVDRKMGHVCFLGDIDTSLAQIDRLGIWA